MSELNQYAALPYVMLPDGVAVCLITSRRSGRWVLPKGWPKPDQTPHGQASTEAFEEAGLRGEISAQPIGTYLYRKRLHMFARAACRVTVFPLLVEVQELDWPERAERELAWLPPGKAANLVAEPGLAELLSQLPAWVAPPQD